MTTLLVSSDPSIGDPIADALEHLGDDVMWCRGPSGIDSVCAAIRGTRCPLTSGIDAVVVDTWLTSDRLNRGFRSRRLVGYYERLGVPVVALTGSHNTGEASRFGPRTIAVPRRTAPAEIAAAVCGAVMLQKCHSRLGRPA
jgi:hypothetical protein